jgi:TolB protein
LVIQSTIGGDLYVVNADGSGLQRLTDGVDPTWSPDGQQIAFTRWREPRGVWVMDANGANEWRVFDWNEARWPSWSPGGEQILFTRQYGGRLEEQEFCFWGRCFTLSARPHWKLGIVDVAGGAFFEPLSDDVSWAPLWSPMADQLVYDGEHGLWIQTVDREVSYQLTHHARDTTPVWSPDGQRIAFARWQHDHWEIYTVDADGRNLRRLTDTPSTPDGAWGNSVSPAWSPDGTHLAFLTDRSGGWEIWIMEANGDGQKPMFEGPAGDLALEYAFLGERSISWTP